LITQQKRRLGRGLAALIGDDAPDEPAPIVAAHSLKHLPIDSLKPNSANPRKAFTEPDLADLAQSIRSKGLLQPLIVRPARDGSYEIVAGERRWRAAQLAQIHEVPVVIRQIDDKETLEIALIENIQRADLNPLEEALAYKQLIDSYDYTQQQLAEGLGKSRSHIANTMRLLTLPDRVRKHIEEGRLTAGHARALVATDNPESVAEKIIALGMSVRQAEDLVRSNSNRPKSAAAPKHKDADTKALEGSLAAALGLGVTINHAGKSGGSLSIKYRTLEQLDGLVRKLSGH
jgi:ParB family chromosome partitioning protein